MEWVTSRQVRSYHFTITSNWEMLPVMQVIRNVCDAHLVQQRIYPSTKTKTLVERESSKNKIKQANPTRKSNVENIKSCKFKLRTTGREERREFQREKKRKIYKKIDFFGAHTTLHTITGVLTKISWSKKWEGSSFLERLRTRSLCTEHTLSIFNFFNNFRCFSVMTLH